MEALETRNSGLEVTLFCICEFILFRVGKGKKY